MTTIQVHLLMLGLGILAFMLLAGVFSKRNPQTRQRHWVLGLLAGLAVALSPFSRFWREPGQGVDLVTQSLLIAAISLLALLLFALLRIPFKSRSNKTYKRDPNAQHNAVVDAGPTPIFIDANTNDGSSESMTTGNGEVTVDKTPKPDLELTNLAEPELALTDLTDHVQSDPLFDAATYNDPLRPESETVTIDKSLYPKADQADNNKRDASDIELAVPMYAKRDSTQRLDASLSSSNAANDQSSATNLESGEEQLFPATTPSNEESLDLTETEQLFAEIRSQRREVELPDDQELLDATQQSSMDELDLETELVSNDDLLSAEPQISEAEISEDNIEEAEVLDTDEANLEFGNDLTGEYAHPGGQTPKSINFVDSDTAENVHVPETLDHALIAAKVSAVSLQAQVANLEESIGELDGLRDESIDAAKNHIAEHEALINQSNELLSREDEARRAAESVIEAQRALIVRAKQQQIAVDNLLQQERQRLTLLQEEVERSRKMARTAAHLARKAAVAQQEIRNLAKREQTARLKSQESTRKAVDIARNAISALAEEERKRGVTRH